MAFTKEYQLWVLVKASNNHRVIEGIKIIRARPGSVILDVLVKHTENVLPEEAFEVFTKAMSTPASTTRVQNILKIKQGTTQVEFVPVVLGKANSGGGYFFDRLLSRFMIWFWDCHCSHMKAKKEFQSTAGSFS